MSTYDKIKGDDYFDGFDPFNELMPNGRFCIPGKAWYPSQSFLDEYGSDANRSNSKYAYRNPETIKNRDENKDIIKKRKHSQ